MSINRHDTRILHGFEYHAPASVADAVELLQTHGEEASILAGGTDLVPKMKQALLRPKYVVNLKRIPELAGVREEAERIRAAGAEAARAEAERIMADARARIQREQDEAERDVEGYSLELSEKLLQKAVGSFFTPEESRRIASRAAELIRSGVRGGG